MGDVCSTSCKRSRRSRASAGGLCSTSNNLRRTNHASLLRGTNNRRSTSSANVICSTDYVRCSCCTSDLCGTNNKLRCTSCASHVRGTNNVCRTSSANDTCSTNYVRSADHLCCSCCDLFPYGIEYRCTVNLCY